MVHFFCEGQVLLMGETFPYLALKASSWDVSNLEAVVVDVVYLPEESLYRGPS